MGIVCYIIGIVCGGLGLYDLYIGEITRFGFIALLSAFYCLAMSIVDFAALRFNRGGN